MNILQFLKQHKEETKDALIYGEERITYREFYNTCCMVANGWKNVSDVVGVFIPNSIDYMVTFFSVIMSDKVILPINIMLKSQEVERILKNCNATSVVTISSYREFFESMDYPFDVIYIDLDREKLNIKDRSCELEQLRKDDDVCLIIPTSGTTGKEKYVQLTHTNLYMNSSDVYDIYHLKPYENELNLLPFTFAYCISVEILPCIRTGMTITILKGGFSVKRFYDAVKKDKITYSIAVPSMLQLLVDCYNEKKHDISTLKRISIGGERLDEHVQKKVNDLWKDMVIIYGYGMSEASPVITTKTYDDYNYKLDSVGLPLSHVKVKIVDELDQELPRNERGIIMATGPNIMKGYLNLETDIIRDGWLDTGDIGYQDEEGYIYIIGRKKNLIISSGQNIYPEEIEEVLIKHSNVKEARVSGEKDDILGEIVVAEVILENKDAFDVEELIEFCKPRLATYKIPRKYYVRDEFERTATNKMKRSK